MMANRRKVGFRAGGFVAMVGMALVVAACGSSNTTSTSTATSAAAAAPAATKGVSISTAKGSAGTYLAGAGGRTVYLWVADSGGKSSCSGACAKAWPPLLTKSSPVAGSGVTSSDLGTITRSDGTKQVTYKSHPLYYFIEDSGKGATKGQGSNSFGAKWWLVAPSGSAITSGGSSSAAPASSSSSSSAGGGWG
jgi:predicted lipoprotein with Yx(FWY)xxD motif